MEVLAVGLDYDNKTATVSVSVFVGIPTVNSSFSKQPSVTENFTNYEIYLTAVNSQSGNNNPFTNPPSSCLTDSFLQHSRREVFVDDDCSSTTSGTNNTLEVPTANPAAAVPWESLCIDRHTVNIT